MSVLYFDPRYAVLDLRLSTLLSNQQIHKRALLVSIISNIVHLHFSSSSP
jgi:hypothetical protein